MDTFCIVKLKYLDGLFTPISENQVDLRVFSVKWVEDDVFLVGSDEGLCLLRL